MGFNLAFKGLMYPTIKKEQYLYFGGIPFITCPAYHDQGYSHVSSTQILVGNTVAWNILQLSLYQCVKFPSIVTILYTMWILYKGQTHNMLSHKPTTLQLSVMDIYPPPPTIK
jgi:hypothetical protein